MMRFVVNGTVPNLWVGHTMAMAFLQSISTNAFVRSTDDDDDDNGGGNQNEFK